MALEPITRQEKIIAGQDLTPITRMEKFLKNFGGGGGGSVPKPLTYDYMPEGYPKKTMGTVTVMAEQGIEFSDDHGSTEYYGNLAGPFEISEGQTYTVNWDGTAYVCVCVLSHSRPVLGNLSVVGAGDDTGEPFFFDATGGMFITLNTSATHTISVTTVEEVITPMAAVFLPSEVDVLIMNSSTTNSTKKFKITVNDSGTISATEVT